MARTVGSDRALAGADLLVQRHFLAHDIEHGGQRKIQGGADSGQQLLELLLAALGLER